VGGGSGGRQCGGRQWGGTLSCPGRCLTVGRHVGATQWGRHVGATGCAGFVRLRLIVNTVNHQLALGTGGVRGHEKVGIGTPAGKIQILGVGRHELLKRLRRRPSKNTPALQHARRLADNDIEGVVDPRKAAVLRLRAGDDEDV
jgi:hypothetical protein